MTLVKVCGIRDAEEGAHALTAGASWLGFVFWVPSKRYVEPDQAARVVDTLRQEYGRGWSAVGVFVEPDPDEARRIVDACKLDYVQLSGHEEPSLVAAMPLPVVKAVHVQVGDESAAAAAVREDRFGAQLYLLDTHREGMYGGTGEAFDWAALRQISARCLVAGGLRPENVGAAIELLRPHGVDVSGGVEYAGGGKDPRLVAAFTEAVRMQDEQLSRQETARVG